MRLVSRSPDKWLQDLEQVHEQRQDREQRTRYLWVEADATDAEVEAACHRRIAEETAGADDRFVVFRWRSD
jgi:hypothetical protein